MTGKEHPSGAAEGASSKLSVLLVEDAEGDAQILHEYVLSASARAQVELVHVRRWSDAVNMSMSLDAVLLDLNLPDSVGLDTIRRARERFTNLPIIVLTGTDDHDVASAALSSGAEDYVVKGSFHAGDALVRAITYAIERKRLENDLRQAREALEVRRARAHCNAETALTEGEDVEMGGVRRKVEALLHEYLELLAEFVTALRNERPRPRMRVRSMAQRLEMARAGARHVVGLHLMAMRRAAAHLLPADERELARDARLLLVELLGCTMDLYRGGERLS